jgi:uncharacterized Zn-finger protein
MKLILIFLITVGTIALPIPTNLPSIEDHLKTSASENHDKPTLAPITTAPKDFNPHPILPAQAPPSPPPHNPPPADKALQTASGRSILPSPAAAGPANPHKAPDKTPNTTPAATGPAAGKKRKLESEAGATTPAASGPAAGKKRKLESDAEAGGKPPSTRHREKKFGCSQCGQLSESQRDQNRHMNTHTGGAEPQDCNVAGCDKSYTRKDNLKRHKKDAHGIT